MGGVRSQKSERGVGLRLPGFSTSTSRELSFNSWAPESNGLQRVTAVAGTNRKCVGAGKIGQETASLVHQSTNSPSWDFLPSHGPGRGNTGLPAPSAHTADRITSLQPVQIRWSYFTLPHPSMQPKTWRKGGSAHTSVTHPDWRATLKEAPGCQLTTLRNT